MPTRHVGFFPLAAPFVASALLILAVPVLLIELRAIEYAYERIGVSSRYLSLTLLATLLGQQREHPAVAGSSFDRIFLMRILAALLA